MLQEKTSVTGRAVSLLASGAPINAIVPTTIEDVFRLADLVHQSGLAPYQLKSAQAVAVVLMKGLEIGLPPMAALESIGVINGRAALYGDGIPALLWSKGFKLKEWYEGDGDKMVAKIIITRPDGTEYAGEYSVQDAKDNGLWDTREKVERTNRDGSVRVVANDAPWFRYKKRMLKMRARGWTARDGAPDVLKGMPIFEEVRDTEAQREMRDITPAREPAQALTDIPDLPTDEPIPDLPVDAEQVEDDDIIADADGVLNRIREDLDAAGDDPGIRDEVLEQYESLIARLPRNRRAEAEALFA